MTLWRDIASGSMSFITRHSSIARLLCPVDGLIIDAALHCSRSVLEACGLVHLHHASK